MNDQPIDNEELQRIRDLANDDIALAGDMRTLLAELDRLHIETAEQHAALIGARTARDLNRSKASTLEASLHAVEAVITTVAEGRDPSLLCLKMDSPAWHLADLLAKLSGSKNDA